MANAEWSPATPAAAEVSRARIALSIASKKLAAADSAGTEGKAGTGAGRARLASHAESLRPVLCALVLRVVAAACAARGATGMQSRTGASELTDRLLKQWTDHVHEHGMFDTPAFAVEDGVEVLPVGMNEAGAAEIREAVMYGPQREMWQLCLPGELDVLDLSAPPSVVRFAPTAVQGGARRNGAVGHGMDVIRRVRGPAASCSAARQWLPRRAWSMVMADPQFRPAATGEREPFEAEADDDRDPASRAVPDGPLDGAR